jgi:fructose/tagatose bisphosphate aldolase
VNNTGVDALAVNVGQMHLHGRQEVGLDLDRLAELVEAVDVPLVLHGATSMRREDLAAAIEVGVRKINVGSMLKQAFLGALRDRCAALPEQYNPYEAIGSGLQADVLVAGRLAMQRTVEKLMHLFRSTGRA